MATALMQGERLLAQTRQHWSVVAPALAGIAVVLVAALVADALLPARIGGVDINRIRAIAAAVLVVVALVAAAVRYLKWRYVRYVLTNRRIIRETGVFSRDVESIELGRIQNTNMHRPLGDRFVGAGNIDIESAGREGQEFLHRVPRCEDFYTQLLQAIDTWRQGGSAAPVAPADQPAGL